MVSGRTIKPRVFYLSWASGAHIYSKQQTSHVLRHRMCHSFVLLLMY